MRSMLAMLCLLLLAGCGGLPEPQINGRKPRPDQTLVRVSMVATNYDEAWDQENVRLVCIQQWLNDDDVPVKNEPVFTQRFDSKQGVTRGTITLKDWEGDSTNWVFLEFKIISGENDATENVSAATTIEWKVSSDIAEKDAAFIAYISRKARNNYAIDALYAMDPATGATEQVLPRN